MCNNEALFGYLKNSSEFKIVTANNSIMKGNSKGDINMKVSVDENTVSDIVLREVLYLSEAHTNLLSIAWMFMV